MPFRRRFRTSTRRLGFFLIAVILSPALGYDAEEAIGALVIERSSSSASTSPTPTTTSVNTAVADVASPPSAGGPLGEPPAKKNSGSDHLSLPLVVHTWPWTQAAAAGYAVFSRALDRAREEKTPLSLDAAVAAASRAERDRCDGTVGAGGNTDELGRVTLDAVVMDGATMRAGGVAAIEVEEAVATARLVMETTTHSLLVGRQATAFAEAVGGFRRPGQRGLRSKESEERWEEWKRQDCQPNFRREVEEEEEEEEGGGGGKKSRSLLVPDPRTSCGPYRRRKRREIEERGESPLPSPPRASLSSHDTIAVVAIDAHGQTAAAASSNGAAHKVPGRAGDAAVPGGGAYATRWGGCGSTGDGDAHLRYFPCVRAMMSLEASAGEGSPQRAAEEAIRFIAEREPSYVGALVVACSRTGRIGAAAFGWNFSYTVARKGIEGGKPVVFHVEPILLPERLAKGDVER